MWQMTYTVTSLLKKGLQLMIFRTAARIDAPGPDQADSRKGSRRKRLIFRVILPVVSVAAVTAAVLATTLATHAALPQSPAVGGNDAVSSPVSTSSCKSSYHLTCYTPAQYRDAYDMNALYSGKATGKPLTGAGETIVIVERYGSPTIVNDLRVFDAQLKLPKAALTIEKLGDIPAFDANSASMIGTAEETSVDVEYAHAFAPGAKIVLVETDSGTGLAALGPFMKGVDAAVKQGVGDVLVLGLAGFGENSFPGFSSGNYSSLLNLRYAIKDAYARNMTMLAASGDTGPTNYTTFEPPYSVYKKRVVAWPASDPLVTAVGGTAINLADNGSRLGPDTVWNDVYGASGGGDSTVFSRPAYQNSVAGIVGDHRGTPDISLSAVPGGWGYYSFPGGGGSGWHIFAGTSEATPIMAAMVALADQAAGHKLGLINPALYKLGEMQQAGAKGTGIESITSGTNTFDGVTGYHAAAGYNLATGWGTINAAQFVPALARLG